ncbi:hypothetical protein AA989_09095 [Enterococcus cecorum]|nr:hypothetical protein AA989_09095 [Enterococcus cecorum]
MYAQGDCHEKKDGVILHQIKKAQERMQSINHSSWPQTKLMEIFAIVAYRRSAHRRGFFLLSENVRKI